MPSQGIITFEGVDFDDPVVHDPFMYLVTHSIHSFYGDVLPTDPTDAAAVKLVLATGGNTHLSTLVTVGRLPVEVFLQVDPANQWPNTEKNLWLQILADMGKDPKTKKPAKWAKTIRIMEIRNYLRSLPG